MLLTVYSYGGKLSIQIASPSHLVPALNDSLLRGHRGSSRFSPVSGLFDTWMPENESQQKSAGLAHLWTAGFLYFYYTSIQAQRPRLQLVIDEI
jgi:hypothetical protein